MFQFPGLAFVPYLFRSKYFFVRRQRTDDGGRINPSSRQLSSAVREVGFPIRKFTDQSLFAAPHDLSQRTTSFFASQRQGIHRILLRHLIALIIDAHRLCFDASSRPKSRQLSGPARRARRPLHNQGILRARSSLTHDPGPKSLQLLGIML